MSLQIINCEQGSPEWFSARLGIPTASEFKTLIGVKKDAKDKVTRRKYMLKLAGEIITGQTEESYTNQHLERGKEMEPLARNYYASFYDAEPQQVGFIRNGQCGCSPDSLVGDAGALEIKTALPSIVGDLILKDAFPPEHVPQTQGVLMVAEREWVDLLVYWPRMPKFIKRAYRDEEYIKQLRDAVDEFNYELAEIVQRLRGHDQPDLVRQALKEALRASVAAA